MKTKQYPQDNTEQRSSRRPMTALIKIVTYALLAIVLLLVGAMLFTATMSFWVQQSQDQWLTNAPAQFPVTVNPEKKTIIENPEVDAYLESANSPLQASAIEAGDPLLEVLTSIAAKISEVPWYQNIASVVGIDSQAVTIVPGMRKEQVMDAFGKALGWNSQQKKIFATAAASSTLPLAEGSFFPDTYFVNTQMTPSTVQALVDKRFTENILAHYGTSTAQVVPLDEALTIASIIQRETIGNDDMRLISGIIWNRIFLGMNLQIDSTLQYAKANNPKEQQWWPSVVPKDKYIKSPYNTYLYPGLPPTPIANPSVAAVLAALNPIETPCLYYFSDKDGNFHCSESYAGQVALLKQYYGEGK